MVLYQAVNWDENIKHDMKRLILTINDENPIKLELCDPQKFGEDRFESLCCCLDLEGDVNASDADLQIN